MEKFESTEEGSAQGSVMSPMLANIYMHNDVNAVV